MMPWLKANVDDSFVDRLGWEKPGMTPIYLGSGTAA